jgi:hypothetical protein
VRVEVCDDCKKFTVDAIEAMGSGPVCVCKKDLYKGIADEARRRADDARLHDEEMDRCERDRMSRTAYRVKPYDWSKFGKGGTSYCIEAVRVVATSRSEDDATMIARALNENKKLSEKLNNARDLLVWERSKRREAKAAEPSTVYETEVFTALKANIARLPHARWSSHRSQIVAFAKNVAQSLGVHGKLED